VNVEAIYIGKSNVGKKNLDLEREWRLKGSAFMIKKKAKIQIDTDR
jgi:hypothetical protein